MNIISIIVTLISIFVAIYYGQKTRHSDKINMDLNEKVKKSNVIRQTQIETELQTERNKVAPRLQINGSTQYGSKRKRSIRIENHGGTATIEQIDILSPEYTQHSKFLPLDIGETAKYIYFETGGEPGDKFPPIHLKIKYRDINYNYYIHEIVDNNGVCKFKEKPIFIGKGQE